MFISKEQKALLSKYIKDDLVEGLFIVATDSHEQMRLLGQVVDSSDSPYTYDCPVVKENIKKFEVRKKSLTDAHSIQKIAEVRK